MFASWLIEVGLDKSSGPVLAEMSIGKSVVVSDHLIFIIIKVTQPKISIHSSRPYGLVVRFILSDKTRVEIKQHCFSWCLGSLFLCTDER